MDCKTTWIQCSRNLCGKWRVVTDEIAAEYADIPWTCDMNENSHYNRCTVPEQKVHVPPGKKLVMTKFPYEKGEIIMAKMAGYCLWPAFISPDPNCDEYYDAVLNENDEQEEFTHIHVEFFGRPRTHAWVTVDNVFPYSAGTRSSAIQSKWKKSFDIAMKEADESFSLTSEERLQCRAFKLLDCKSNDREGLCDTETGNNESTTSDERRFLQSYYNFKLENGVDVCKIKSPKWCGKKDDLYNIFVAVIKHGGYLEVCRKQLWLMLREGLLEDVQLINKPSGNMLKQFYEKNMFDFELHLKQGKTSAEESQILLQAQNSSFLSEIPETSLSTKVPKKRGRPKRSMMESSKCDVLCNNLSSYPSHSKDLDVLSTENGTPSRKRTKTTSKNSESDIFAVQLLTTSGTNSNESNNEKNNVSIAKRRMISRKSAAGKSAKTMFQPTPEEPKLAKKQAKRKSKSFVEPLLTSNITSGNNLQEEQTKSIVEQIVPPFRQITAAQPETKAKPQIPNPTSLKQGMSNASTNTIGTDQHLCPSSPYTVENKVDFCPSPTYEPEDFTMVGQHSPKVLCPKISGFEYVPSSNPNSPQVVPTEEDLEEDCGISIQRELDEIERMLQDDSCNSSCYSSRINSIESLNRQQEPKPNEDRVPLTDDAVKDAIQSMLKLDEDISQLEASTELDFL